MVQTVHEAYSFACMRCGYGWEQDYRIEHHVDGAGQPFIMYKVKGERVPSPLSNPTCHNCGGHVVRIMRAGQVNSVLGTIDRLYHHRIAPGIAGPVPAGADVPRRRRHDSPGPVSVEEAERGRGWFSRLMGRLRRS
jgi:ribosomal protein S27AE